MADNRNRVDRPAPSQPWYKERWTLLIVAAIVAVVLFLFLTVDFTNTASDEGSGGPDAEWDAEPQPIPQVPPEGESLGSQPAE